MSGRGRAAGDSVRFRRPISMAGLPRGHAAARYMTRFRPQGRMVQPHIFLQIRQL